MNKKIEKLINRHRFNEKYYFIELNSFSQTIEGNFFHIANQETAGRFIYHLKYNQLIIIYNNFNRTIISFYNREYFIRDDLWTFKHGLKYEKRRCCFCWKGKELK